ncbi:MAG: HAD-IC family P-type ATPase, partial [Candidatus ainarchaeum sp.]|nr:HAD-IC family P-type ATPase [Candidatus ainarchaeum sp.]
MLTGESLPVKKNIKKVKREILVSERKNMAYKNTIVTYGRGTAIVVETGMRTEIGRIAGVLQETVDEAAPIQKKLSEFMKFIGKWAIVGVIFVIVVGVSITHLTFEETLKLSIAQAVSFIPEGLPIVVTILLALGVQTMATKNAIVRKLPAVETLGSITAICTDKTGTITKNEMTVKRIYLFGRLFEVSGEGYEKEGEFYNNGKKISPNDYPALVDIMRTAVLCNNSQIDNDPESNETRVVGDPTEGALITVAEKAGVIKEEAENTFKRISEIPFDSEKKYMVTYNLAGNSKIAHIKGAPEKILSLSKLVAHNGKIKKMDEKTRKEITEASKKMAEDGLRVLGFAFEEVKEIGKEPKEVTFIGIMGMMDPPREEVKKAVQDCKDAGIKIFMITGDHKLTALSIGKQIGLAEDSTRVILGEELEKMSKAELDKVIDETPIYARVSTEHKMIIVDALKRKGHVVAMTGDGVNDALAIKKADVGIAMGLSGTEVTRESGDMILSDDNFKTIVSAVEEGRSVFVNLRKIVRFLFATNLGEVIFLFMILLSGLYFPETLPLALLPIHILWVNLVTDGVCDVTLAMDPKEKDLMKRKPRNPKEGIITKNVGIFVISSAVIIAIGTFLVFIFELERGGLDHARTVAFTTLAFFQLFSAINTRSDKSVFNKDLFSNKYFIGAIILSVLLQLSIIYIPFLGEAMKTIPLNAEDWIIIIVASSSILIIFEIVKFIKSKVYKNQD